MSKISCARLRELRQEKGISQVSLAEELGVSRTAIGYYENDERTPDIDFIAKAAQHFQVTSDYLIGLSNNRTVETEKIGKGLGLSDKAIEILQLENALLGEYDLSDIVSYLIEQEEREPNEGQYYLNDPESGEKILKKKNITQIT